MARARRAIGIQAEDLEWRQQILQLRLDALRTGADARDRHRRALGTGLRHRLRVPAVVAAKGAVSMEDQRDIAVGALPGVPTGAAGEMRRPAAPVDQEDRLAALPGNVAERLPRPRVKRPGDAAPHVYDLDRRPRPPVHAAPQLQPIQLVPALRLWRRRPTEEDRSGISR